VLKKLLPMASKGSLVGFPKLFNGGEGSIWKAL
jgi:hypothetical protein